MGRNRPASQITMIHIGTVWLSIFGVHALAAVFFTYLQRAKRQPYLQPWLAGWYLLVLHDLALGMVQWAQASTWPMMLVRVLTAASGVCFFAAARMYTNSRAWKPAAFLMASWLGVFGVSVAFVHLWIASQIGLAALVLCGRLCFLAGGPPAREPGRLDAGCSVRRLGDHTAGENWFWHAGHARECGFHGARKFSVAIGRRGHGDGGV